MSLSSPSSTDSRVQLCSLVSAASGEDPIGSAWSMPRFIIIELPLPWAYETMGSRNVPAGLKEIIYDLYAQGVPWGFLAMAPNPAYSVAGMTRIIEYDLVPDQLTGFTVREFLVPTSEVTHFFVLYGSNQSAPEINAYLQPRDERTRGLFVCTHGAIDACCAKFGYPVFRELSRLADADVATTGAQARVWRCTHFGGHRFAPTVLEMPGGRYWGRL